MTSSASSSTSIAYSASLLAGQAQPSQLSSPSRHVRGGFSEWLLSKGESCKSSELPQDSSQKVSGIKDLLKEVYWKLDAGLLSAFTDLKEYLLQNLEKKVVSIGAGSGVVEEYLREMIGAERILCLEHQNNEYAPEHTIFTGTVHYSQNKELTPDDARNFFHAIEEKRFNCKDIVLVILMPPTNVKNGFGYLVEEFSARQGAQLFLFVEYEGNERCAAPIYPHEPLNEYLSKGYLQINLANSFTHFQTIAIGFNVEQFPLSQSHWKDSRLEQANVSSFQYALLGSRYSVIEPEDEQKVISFDGAQDTFQKWNAARQKFSWDLSESSCSASRIVEFLLANPSCYKQAQRGNHFAAVIEFVRLVLQELNQTGKVEESEAASSSSIARKDALAGTLNSQLCDYALILLVNNISLALPTDQYATGAVTDEESKNLMILLFDLSQEFEGHFAHIINHTYVGHHGLVGSDRRYAYGRIERRMKQILEEYELGAIRSHQAEALLAGVAQDARLIDNRQAMRPFLIGLIRKGYAQTALYLAKEVVGVDLSIRDSSDSGKCLLTTVIVVSLSDTIPKESDDAQLELFKHLIRDTSVCYGELSSDPMVLILQRGDRSVKQKFHSVLAYLKALLEVNPQIYVSFKERGGNLANAIQTQDSKDICDVYEFIAEKLASLQVQPEQVQPMSIGGEERKSLAVLLFYLMYIRGVRSFTCKESREWRLLQNTHLFPKEDVARLFAAEGLINLIYVHVDTTIIFEYMHTHLGWDDEFSWQHPAVAGWRQWPGADESTCPLLRHVPNLSGVLSDYRKRPWGAFTSQDNFVQLLKEATSFSDPDKRIEFADVMKVKRDPCFSSDAVCIEILQELWPDDINALLSSYLDDPELRGAPFHPSAIGAALARFTAQPRIDFSRVRTFLCRTLARGKAMFFYEFYKHGAFQKEILELTKENVPLLQSILLAYIEGRDDSSRTMPEENYVYQARYTLQTVIKSVPLLSTQLREHRDLILKQRCLKLNFSILGLEILDKPSSYDEIFNEEFFLSVLENPYSLNKDSFEYLKGRVFSSEDLGFESNRTFFSKVRNSFFNIIKDPTRLLSFVHRMEEAGLEREIPWLVRTSFAVIDKRFTKPGTNESSENGIRLKNELLGAESGYITKYLKHGLKETCVARIQQIHYETLQNLMHLIVDMDWWDNDNGSFCLEQVDAISQFVDTLCKMDKLLLQIQPVRIQKRTKIDTHIFELMQAFRTILKVWEKCPTCLGDKIQEPLQDLFADILIRKWFRHCRTQQQHDQKKLFPSINEIESILSIPPKSSSEVTKFTSIAIEGSEIENGKYVAISREVRHFVNSLIKPMRALLRALPCGPGENGLVSFRHNVFTSSLNFQELFSVVNFQAIYEAYLRYENIPNMAPIPDIEVRVSDEVVNKGPSRENIVSCSKYDLPMLVLPATSSTNIASTSAAPARAPIASAASTSAAPPIVPSITSTSHHSAIGASQQPPSAAPRAPIASPASTSAAPMPAIAPITSLASIGISGAAACATSSVASSSSEQIDWQPRRVTHLNAQAQVSNPKWRCELVARVAGAIFAAIIAIPAVIVSPITIIFDIDWLHEVNKFIGRRLSFQPIWA